MMSKRGRRWRGLLAPQTRVAADVDKQYGDVPLFGRDLLAADDTLRRPRTTLHTALKIAASEMRIAMIGDRSSDLAGQS